ncbi:MAG: DegT/DnrJ/EryC1/StrS family aminotransferase, partial [Vicinamibacterales bacterium]
MTGSRLLRLRHVAPAGAPIRLPDLARWAGLAFTGGDVAASLQQAFCDRFGVRHSFLTSTGRAGMTLVLRALRRLAAPHRDEVVVPSYTCYSVAASIVKAGLRPRIVDIAPDTLDYAPDALARADFTRVLAIVATNLYGLPNDLSATREVARAHGVFLVDDAAQAMGASVGGRRSGTWG